ncbi:zinc-binding alcohol dehydrogenase family protein, partial [Devosia sp.]|uniref:zinc-binding alcohol dehydrogenase family protein n=1 Tax=Devosia sp. TaxID=1871048 RepID=UPI003A8DBCA2
ASPMPDGLDYVRAAVLPLALSTAAAGLFEPGQLGLGPPKLKPVATGRTVLIWGGSTSVGSNAIQLAVAAGYEVIATASPRNFDRLRQLGAAEVFDYRSKTAVRDIIAACGRRDMAGALAIGAGSAGPCIDIMAATGGDKAVSMASTPLSFESVPLGPGRGLWLAKTMPRLIAATAGLMLKARLRGVRTASIFSTSIASNAVGPMIYADFLPQALQAGRYWPSPDPELHGAGLDRIQSALEAHKRGVSAKKLVVTL